ncbi:MAG TPA: LytR C-terminal domain-containing protein [Gemmatimonadaceae bacterium]|nr:LytR C-terminal domain-containing protein [Gemmatimonadaceae bacterium]
MKRRRMFVLGGLLICALFASVVAARRYADRGPISLLGDTTSAPQGQRVLVEVLNSSGVSGLARRASFLLRDRGFDVIGWGNDPQGRRSETLIIDYTDKPEAADRLARVLGGAKVEPGKDSLQRGIDLTVLLGSTWKPPVESFHP